MRLYRYARWDGARERWPATSEGVLERLADRVLGGCPAPADAARGRSAEVSGYVGTAVQQMLKDKKIAAKVRQASLGFGQSERPARSGALRLSVHM